jgi:hypothetical protein
VNPSQHGAFFQLQRITKLSECPLCQDRRQTRRPPLNVNYSLISRFKIENGKYLLSRHRYPFHESLSLPAQTDSSVRADNYPLDGPSSVISVRTVGARLIPGKFRGAAVFLTVLYLWARQRGGPPASQRPSACSQHAVTCPWSRPSAQTPVRIRRNTCDRHRGWRRSAAGLALVASGTAAGAAAVISPPMLDDRPRSGSGWHATSNRCCLRCRTLSDYHR